MRKSYKKKAKWKGTQCGVGFTMPAPPQAEGAELFQAAAPHSALAHTQQLCRNHTVAYTS